MFNVILEQIIREYVKTWVGIRRDIALDFIKITLRSLKHFASLNKAWRSFKCRPPRRGFKCSSQENQFKNTEK